jgi:hypothetical protein
VIFPARHLNDAMTMAGQLAYYDRFSYLSEPLRGKLMRR